MIWDAMVPNVCFTWGRIPPANTRREARNPIGVGPVCLQPARPRMPRAAARWGQARPTLRLSAAENLILQWPSRGLFVIAWTLLVSFLIASAANSQTLSDETLANLSFEQKLSMQVSLDLLFRDETGKPVRLGDYIGQKPVVL